MRGAHLGFRDGHLEGSAADRDRLQRRGHPVTEVLVLDGESQLFLDKGCQVSIILEHQ